MRACGVTVGVLGRRMGLVRFAGGARTSRGITDQSRTTRATLRAKVKTWKAHNLASRKSWRVRSAPGHRPLVLGGGHETALGDVSGVMSLRSRKRRSVSSTLIRTLTCARALAELRYAVHPGRADGVARTAQRSATFALARRGWQIPSHSSDRAHELGAHWLGRHSMWCVDGRH